MIKNHLVRALLLDFSDKKLIKSTIEDVIVADSNIAENIAVSAVVRDCNVIVMGNPQRESLAEKFAITL